MDFEALQNGLKEFIEDNIETYLTALSITDFPDVVIDYPDLLKYTKNIYIYILPVEYNFENLSNESEQMLMDVELYITIKGYKNADLKSYLSKYIQAIYNLVKENNNLGVFDYSLISMIHPYDAVEGFENSKGAKIMIRAVKET